MKVSLAVFALLGFASTQEVFVNQQVGDLQKCITDVEGLIPGVEKVIADLKAGNTNAAILQLTLLLPKAEAAYADCTAAAKPLVMHRIHKAKKFLSKINVGDLPTCIADLEAAIPDVEKIIADFKAGNYDQALSDALALVPEVEKAYTDCLSSGKAFAGRVKTALKDDPRREYYEKLGAEFASGFFAGTGTDRFDSIDLYNCLHREPRAVEYFYRADQEFKYAFYKKDGDDAVKAMDELIGYLFELVKEDYPHSRVEVCKEFQDKQAEWGNVKKVIDDLKDKETTLRYHHDDHHFTFAHQDITEGIHKVVEEYTKGDWGPLGYLYGKTLAEAATHETTLI